MSYFRGLLTWLAYFLLPNDAGGLIHGLPLGPVEAAALLMLAGLWLIGRRLPGAIVVGALLVATWAAGAAIPGEPGFRARYFASAEGDGRHERSTEHPDAPFTRIDRRLLFTADREFPLPFFNDNSRFNFYKAGEPNRRLLGFAVRWSAMWWSDQERPRLYLHAPDAEARLFVDGTEVMALTPGEGSPILAEVPVTHGWHRLDITFVSPYGGPRHFSAAVMDGDTPRYFDGATVVTQQIRGWQMEAAGWLRRIKLAADVALLLCLAWTLARGLIAFIPRWRTPSWRDATIALAFAAAVEAFVFALPWSTQNMVLIGGDDTMTYEGYARDILLNGILMNGGAPLGQGEPFYYQAFYPYFLAAVHAVFGESMFGPVLIQRLLAAGAAWTLVRIAIALTHEGIWRVALPLAAAFIAWKFWPIAAQPLNESLYVPLLVASAWWLMRASRDHRPRTAAIAGLAAGLATVTRSTVLLGWAAAWPAAWVAMKGARHRTAIVATIAATCLAIFSLITVRNWIVAGVFAPSSTELGITLLGGNEVPPDVTIDPAPRAALYRQFGISEFTSIVIEYAITAPGQFALNLGRKALFALGFYEPYAPGWGYSPVYIAVWTSALWGLLLAARRSDSWIVATLPALIAATQYVALVIVYPKGERLIVPIHTLLVPYACVAAAQVLDHLTGRMSRA